MSLGRRLLSRGRKPEARQIVAEIYGWFNEGFDTWDLRDAKDVVDQLT